jgi:hypothetical protein
MPTNTSRSVVNTTAVTGLASQQPAAQMRTRGANKVRALFFYPVMTALTLLSTCQTTRTVRRGDSSRWLAVPVITRGGPQTTKNTARISTGLKALPKFIEASCKVAHPHLIAESGVTLATIQATPLAPIALSIWEAIPTSGMAFLDILRMLSVFEDATPNTTASLPAFKGKPPIIARFVASRKLTPGVLAYYQPDHSKKMRDWWRLLQQRQEQDPGALRKAGPKGLSLIVVGLFLWRLHLDREDDQGPVMWWALVADVRRVLRDLLTEVPGFVPSDFHLAPDACRPINDRPPPATFAELEEDDEDKEVEPTARALRYNARRKRTIDEVDEVDIQAQDLGRRRV